MKVYSECYFTCLLDNYESSLLAFYLSIIKFSQGFITQAKRTENSSGLCHFSTFYYNKKLLNYNFRLRLVQTPCN